MSISRVKDILGPLFAISFTVSTFTSTILPPFCQPRRLSWNVYLHSSPLFAIPRDFHENYYAFIAPFCHPRRLSWKLLYIHSPFLPPQETFLKLIVHSSPFFAIPIDFHENYYTFVAPFCHPGRLSWNLLYIRRPFLPYQETFLKLIVHSSLFAISHQIIKLFFNLYILFIFIIYK